MGDAYETNMGQAIEAKRKYGYFFIGLTFSVLALAINHEIDTQLAFPRIAELLGWICLLISGFFGLWRFEWDGVVFKLAAELAKSKGFKYQTMKQGAQAGLWWTKKPESRLAWMHKLRYI